MAHIDRPLAADVLVFDLEREAAHAGDATLLERSGRNARTLLKSGALRVTLVTVAPGGEIPEHHADGPITLHVVAGDIRFHADRDYELAAGQVLAAGPGIRHRVSSAGGGTFLLTVVHADAAG